MQIRFGNTHPHATQFGNEQQAVQFSGDKSPKNIAKLEGQKGKGNTTNTTKGGTKTTRFAGNNWIA